MTAEEYWKNQEKELIDAVGLESMLENKVYLPSEMWEFAEEYSSQCETALFKLHNKPRQVLKPLENLYRAEHPYPDGRFYLPDETEFNKWIVAKITKPLPSEEEVKRVAKIKFPACKSNSVIRKTAWYQGVKWILTQL